MTRATDPAPATTRRLGRQFWAVGIGLIAITLAGAGLMIWAQREAEIDEHKRRVSSLAIVLAEKTLHYTRQVDLLLQDVQRHVDGLRPTTSAQFAALARHEDTTRFLRDRVRGLPTSVIVLIDTTGTMVNVSHDSQGLAAVTFSDRDYFRHLMGREDADLFVGSPVHSRVSGAWVIPLARRITGPRGEPLGLVLSALDIAYLGGFYQRVLSPAGESIALVRPDGLVLARHPPVDATLGRWIALGPQWYEQVLAGGGTYRSADHLTGTPAIAAVARVQGFNLVVDVSTAEAVALAGWFRSALAIACAAVAVSIGFALLFAIIARQFASLAAGNAQLADSERRLRDFAEMASDWFWEQDADTRFTWISEGAPTVLTGDQSYVGKTRWELVGIAMDGDRLAQHQADIDARRPFRDYRYSRVGKDGVTRHLTISGNPVFNDDGVFQGYRGVGRDITAQVAVEEAMRQARHHAEAASRAKSEFLANMGHELRTPLNAIIGFSELIRDRHRDRPNDPDHLYAADIHASGFHLLSLINDLLDMAKLDSGRYEIVEGPVELNATVDGCLHALADNARGAGVTVTATRAADRIVLRADGHALRKIVLNVVGNAIKFTPRGGSVTLRTETAADGGVALVVRDSGVGMEADVLRHVTEPFYQADASMQRRFEGTGLGLSISSRLLALHGGALTIDSKPGEGTTVRIAFPPERVVP
jgi:PAS domain S-box-containing protein